MVILISLMLAIILDLTTRCVQGPLWFYILFGVMSFIACYQIVNFTIGGIND